MSIDPYSPHNIPREVEAYFTKSHSKVDTCGKFGVLRLKFKRDPITGITVIRETV